MGIVFVDVINIGVGGVCIAELTFVGALQKVA